MLGLAQACHSLRRFQISFFAHYTRGYPLPGGTAYRSLENMVANKKRALEDASVNPKNKKSKIGSTESKERVRSEAPVAALSGPIAEEVDFPRGGGSSFTPLEVKAIRAEAAKEANDELFAVCLQILASPYVSN